MNRRDFLATASLSALAGGRAQAQTQKVRWIEQAEALIPRLRESPKFPLAIVRPVADASEFLRWRMEREGAVESHVLDPKQTIVLDFGEHMVARLRFTATAVKRIPDSPARLRLTFGEAPAEIAEPVEPYTGTLSRAWIQDEVINLDALPVTLELGRRYAFRYVKVENVAASAGYSVQVSGFEATAMTSAGDAPAPLPAGTPELLRRIDAVSLATLRDCMQTVFEDGPKRDRRLWIGDLRLQALTNAVTFRNFDLVKRCLLLFAGLAREDGMLSACVYERPKAAIGESFIVDYSALFTALVLEYAETSGDWQAARELWPVVKLQMEILDGYVAADHLFAAPPKSWVFIDWNERLERTGAMHGVYVYALRRAAELARRVGSAEESQGYARRADELAASGHAKFFDPSRRLFVSGGQVSYATQAWMALSGIASPEEGAAALRAAAAMLDAVRPRSPYLCHYVVDAMLTCGMKTEALALIESYWGGMVKAGADTFWEVYDPNDARLSPYRSVQINSYCHAWSCTPSYFLRGRELV